MVSSLLQLPQPAAFCVPVLIKGVAIYTKLGVILYHSSFTPTCNQSPNLDSLLQKCLQNRLLLLLSYHLSMRLLRWLSHWPPYRDSAVPFSCPLTPTPLLLAVIGKTYRVDSLVKGFLPFISHCLQDTLQSVGWHQGHFLSYLTSFPATSSHALCF